MISIGKQIRKQRKASGMSQNDLREKMGLKSVNTINNWEHDKVVPSIGVLNEMYEKFGWVFNVEFITKNK